MGQANSPNKRPRLSPPNDFQLPAQVPNPNQPPNGVPPGAQPQNLQQLLSSLQNPISAAHYLKGNGVHLQSGAAPQDIINMARQFAVANQSNRQLNAYKQNLAVQQQQQGLIARNGLAGVGGASPAGQPATIPFANPGIPGGVPFLGRENDRLPTQHELRELDDVAKAMGGALSHPPSGEVIDCRIIKIN